MRTALRAIRDLSRFYYRRYGPPPSCPRVGSAAYHRRILEEVEHYREVYEEVADGAILMEPAPSAWERIQGLMAARIQERTGKDVLGHLGSRLDGGAGRRMLSLGSGPGGVEIEVARQSPRADYLCIDLNEDLLELGRKRAAQENLPIRFKKADLNTIDLPRRRFDVVFCHASLHHVLDLEHVVGQIGRCLNSSGELVVVDICARNGYRMWAENRRVAKAIWSTLPPEYRVNHTGYPEPRLDRKIWERDTRGAGMECMRSEEVLPALDAQLELREFVPHSGLARRFFDTMYGPNYNLSRPLDAAIVNWIWELDCDLVDRGDIRPETFFAVYRPRR